LKLRIKRSEFSTGDDRFAWLWRIWTHCCFVCGVKGAGLFSDYSNLANREHNVIIGTVSLTLSADHGNGTYDYLYEVSYVGRSASNSASQVFTNVTGANVVSVHHLVNVTQFDNAGDTWTVSEASVTMTTIKIVG